MSWEEQKTVLQDSVNWPKLQKYPLDINVWESALTISEWEIQNSHFFRDKHVFEMRLVSVVDHWLQALIVIYIIKINVINLNWNVLNLKQLLKEIEVIKAVDVVCDDCLFDPLLTIIDAFQSLRQFWRFILVNTVRNPETERVFLIMLGRAKALFYVRSWA